MCFEEGWPTMDLSNFICFFLFILNFILGEMMIVAVDGGNLKFIVAFNLVILFVLMKI